MKVFDNPILQNAARQVMEAKSAEERMVSLQKKHWRKYLSDLGIIHEYITQRPHSFITVRLLRGDPVFYKKAIGSLQDLQSLSGSRLVFEGGGTQNPHIHILVPDKVTKCNQIKILSKRFKVPSHHINVKISTDSELFAKREAYINGDKKGEKVEKVEADNLYRQQHGIDALYHIY